MKNDLSQIIFYLDLKHVHKYGSAKFQPNPLFSSQQMGTEHAGGRKKKVGKLIGDPVGTGCPNKTEPVLSHNDFVNLFRRFVSWFRRIQFLCFFVLLSHMMIDIYLLLKSYILSLTIKRFSNEENRHVNIFTLNYLSSSLANRLSISPVFVSLDMIFYL